jgi:hypothetical protein
MVNKGVSGRASGQITVRVNEKEVGQKVRTLQMRRSGDTIMSIWSAAFNPSGDTSGAHFCYRLS